MPRSKKRTGRPPEGAGGIRIRDYPRPTIRLEPRVFDALKAESKRQERPAWEIVNSALVAYLAPLKDQAPKNEVPPVAADHDRPSAKRPEAAPVAGDLRDVALTAHQCRALHVATDWAAVKDESAVRATLSANQIPDHRTVISKYPHEIDRPNSWQGALALDDRQLIRRVIRRALRLNRQRIDSRIRAAKRTDQQHVEASRRRHRAKLAPRSDAYIEHREITYVRAENVHLRKALDAIPSD